MSRPKFKPEMYVINKDNHFTMKVSTNTTEEIPTVVFLREKVRITPNELKKTHEEDILDIQKRFDIYARKILDNLKDYEDFYIFTIDVAEKSVKYKKTSHLHYDIYLKPKKKITLEQHKEFLKEISDKLDDKLISLFKIYGLKWY